jgi:PAS domain S-box-containing protein
MFGYAPEEVIGRPLGLLIPERLRDRHLHHVDTFAGGREVARGMGERQEEIVGRRKNGEEFPAEASISKLQVGATNVLSVVLRDVSERARVERELRLLAEAGAILASSLDTDQTLAAVANLVVRDFADWCVAEVVDERQRRQIKVACRDPANAEICARLEAYPLIRPGPSLVRDVTTADLEMISQDPEHLALLQGLHARSLITVPLLNHEHLLGGLAFISSTQVYGPDHVHVAEALGDRAAVAIENARLYASAVHAIRLRDEIMGVVAHDLRNPLSTILLQAAALESQRSRSVIHRAAERMNHLVQNLLDVALLEAGQLKVTRGRVAVAAILAEAVDTQNLLAASNAIELRSEAEDEIADVWADRDRLLQVFENLIGNAIKFTAAGGRIVVGAAGRVDETLFWVEDTGAGMSTENLEHVFDRFWQASRANREGVGLGLPITKGIIEAHGGRIWAESEPGRGSTFFFTLPRAREPATR